MKNIKYSIGLLAIAGCLTGCIMGSSPGVKIVSIAKDGTTTTTTIQKSRLVAIGDTSAAVKAIRASVGPYSNSVANIGVSDLSNQTSSSNVVNIINAAANAAGVAGAAMAK